MRLRRLGASALALTLAMGVAACSGQADDAENAPSSLVFWQAPTGGEEVLKIELAAFTAETRVQVKLEQQNWATYFQQLTTALTTGEGPDVAAIGNTWTAAFEPTGGLLPLDDATLATIGGKDQFLPVPFTSTGPVGKTPVSVPWLGYAYGLFYNKKMFADAGLKPPATWTEFVAAGKKLTRNGVYALDYAGQDANNMNTTFLWALIRQHGGNLYDSAGKPTLTDPGVLAAVEQYVGWLGNDKIANPASAEYTSNENVNNNFAKGKTAMVIQQNTSGAAFVTAGMKAEDYGVVAAPVLDPLPAGGKAVQSHVAGINLAVFNESKNKDAALKLVKWLSSQRQQIALNKANGSLPVIASAYSDPAFTTPDQLVFKKVLESSSETLPMVPSQGQMQQILGAAVAKLLARAATGSISSADVAAAMNDADKQLDAVVG